MRLLYYPFLKYAIFLFEHILNISCRILIASKDYELAYLVDIV